MSDAVTVESTPLLCLLGSPHLRLGDRRRELPASAPGLLLACLAMQGDWVPRERLVALFWPQAPEADAQRQLRVTLHRARQQLQAWGLAPRLHGEHGRLRLDIDCDVPRFRAANARGDWAEAVAWHRAPLLDGAGTKGFAELDEWLMRERGALVTTWRNAALRQAALLESRGDAAGAAALLQAQLQFDLLAEDAVQALLRVATDAGERSTALATFERFVERSEAELGLPPLPETRALAQALRQAAPASRGAAPIRPAVPASLMAPPLVGRRGEWARLRNAGPGLLVVAGEPGVGKTRLTRDALPAATVWRCRDGLQSIPLLPAAEWLKSVAPRVAGAVTDAASLRELARLEPSLLPGERLPPPEGDSARLLLALCAVVPRLTDTLLVDDLQWVDAATLRLLNLLAEDGPLRIVATLRAAETGAELQRWLDSVQAAGRLERIDLAPLPADATAELVSGLSGRPVPKFANWLQRASGGNPFFALETLRSLFEGAQLHAGADPWGDDLEALAARDQPPPVPPRVAALVQQRLEGLPGAARRALLVAALVGDAQGLEALAPAAGLTPLAMADAVDQAQRAGLLRGLEFAHDLVRETLVQHAAPALRRVLHGGIARHASRPPHVLAEHWWAGGQEAEAVEQTQRAWALERQRGLLQAAAALLEGALARCTDAGRRARLQSLLAATASQAGDFEGAARWAAATLAGAPGPAARLEALFVQADLALGDGRADEAERLVQQALAVDALAVDAVMLAAHLAYIRGDFERAARLLEDLMGSRRGRDGDVEQTSILMSLGAIRFAQGRVADALIQMRLALVLARQSGARYEEAAAARNLMQVLTETGAVDEAIEIGRAALALGEYDSTPVLQNNLGSAYLRAGRLDEARAVCEAQALSRDPMLRCMARAKLMEVHGRQGRADEAAGVAEAVFADIQATDRYFALATAVTAVLNHGRADQWLRAQKFLRDQPLDRSTQERLDAALVLRGLQASPVNTVNTPV